MRYTVVVGRNDDPKPRSPQWTLSVPELDGAVLDTVMRVTSAEERARECLATRLNIAPGDIEFDVVLADIGDVTGLQDRSRELIAKRERWTQLEEEIGREARALASGLAAAGVVDRDIAPLIGVHPSRVNSLVNGAAPTGATRKSSPTVVSS